MLFTYIIIRETFGDRQKVSIKGQTERYCISRYFSLMRLAYSVLLRVFSGVLFY